MKTKFLILLILTSFHYNAGISQTAYYDAVALRKLVVNNIWPDNEETKKTVTDILSRYCRRDEIDSVFLVHNPFIRDFAINWTNRSGEGFVGGQKSGASSFLSKIGGVDVTKFANAIGDLMIDRAKQELTIAFFNHFRKFANDNPEFQILFPKTTGNLNNLLSYKYPQMLPALRNGFFEDLEKITYHLDDVLELPKYRHLLRNFPQVTLAIRSIRLVHELETGNYNAADLIKETASYEEWNKGNSTAFRNMGNTVRFASIISESLRDNITIWIDARDVKSLVTDETLLKLYLGLIYRQVENAKLKIYTTPGDLTKTQNLCDLIAAEKDNLILFQNKIAEFMSLADKVMEATEEINNTAKPSKDDIYNYISTSIDVTEYAFSIIKIFNQSLVSDKYMAIAKKSNALYKDIYTKQYTQAVSDAVDILVQVHDLTKEDATVPALAITIDNIILDKEAALETLINFIKKMKPYALFMANVVEAKDEKEIKAALESVILPVGSSSIKKYTKTNVSIQSYLGAFYTVSNRGSTIDGAWSDKFGVTAPVGISYTPGCFSWQKAGSLSLFAALFDIGAIVDYKLKKEPDAASLDPDAKVLVKDYKVELGNIFSPGIYVVYGAGGNLPLSLGFGTQYGPGLSKIKTDNTTVMGNPSWRWNLFLAVDLPFFNIINRSKDREW